MPLLNGASLIGIPQEVALSPGQLASALRRERITILWLTSALFNQVAREAPGAFSRLRSLLSAARRWIRHRPRGAGEQPARAHPERLRSDGEHDVRGVVSRRRGG